MKFTLLNMRKVVAMLAVLPIFALCVACGEDPTDELEGPGTETPGEQPGEDDKYEDIKEVDGKVRFFLSEQPNSTRAAMGISRTWTSSKVAVNGKTYEVAVGEDQRPYVDVDASKSATYNAVLTMTGSNKWYGSSTYADVKLPHSQIRHTAASTMKTYPMYASYTKENGNKLIFNDGFAVVLVKLKGSAKITSVKVENPTGAAISGLCSMMPSKGSLSVSKGFDFAVLNSTNNGDFTKLSTSKTTSFSVMVAPGTYSQGLKVTICDAGHLAMFHTTEKLTLAAGDVHTIEMTYAPDSDLALYEGFDNFVWGGDVMNGSEGFGFSPTDATVGIDSSADLTGYEEAFAQVAYDNPGTGFIQSNTWADVNGKTVGESHRMSESYVKSRNLDDTRCMFRTQEHPGYIAVGAGNTARGIYTTPRSLGMKGIGRMKATIRFAMQAGFNGSLLVHATDGGVITEAKLNGVAMELTENNLSYASNASVLNMRNKVTIPSNVANKKEWNTLELVVNGATDGTCFFIADENSNSGVHGVYVDSVEARSLGEWERPAGTLRVLLWNVLCGMWCDQHNNYDNFVAWVKKYDPDVCIWCESESLYPDNSASGSLSESQKFLPNGWAQLCTRYGHIYAAVGGNRDGFPQTITSKYPIKTVLKITDTDDEGYLTCEGKRVKRVSHGAGHFTIEVNGKKVNFVTLHMWPQSYADGVSSSKREESTSKKEGDYFRRYEMQYIVNKTVNNPTHAAEQYWVFGGDTNSRSRLDAWYHNYAEDNTALITHDVVRNQTNMKDVIGDYYPRNYFMSSTYGSARIDILYASPEMYKRIKNSITVIDEWCAPRLNGNARGWNAPSDHRPVIVDFDMN